MMPSSIRIPPTSGTATVTSPAAPSSPCLRPVSSAPPLSSSTPVIKTQSAAQRARAKLVKAQQAVNNRDFFASRQFYLKTAVAEEQHAMQAAQHAMQAAQYAIQAAPVHHRTVAEQRIRVAEEKVGRAYAQLQMLSALRKKPFESVPEMHRELAFKQARSALKEAVKAAEWAVNAAARIEEI
jgi:hypothetical protein